MSLNICLLISSSNGCQGNQEPKFNYCVSHFSDKWAIIRFKYQINKNGIDKRGNCSQASQTFRLLFQIQAVKDGEVQI